MAGNQRSGRRKKANALKAQDGSRQPRNEGEPQVRVEAPDRPAHLTGEAAAEWDRLVPLLIETRVISVQDRTALAEYCELVAMSVRISQEIAAPEFKPLILEPVWDQEGNQHWKVKPNPLVAMKRQTAAQLRSYLAEFGLTPSSRTRVKAAPVSGEVDPFAEFEGADTSTTDSPRTH